MMNNMIILSAILAMFAIFFVTAQTPTMATDGPTPSAEETNPEPEPTSEPEPESTNMTTPSGSESFGNGLFIIVACAVNSLLMRL